MMISEKRSSLVEELRSQARTLLSGAEVERGSVEIVAQGLRDLASHNELWSTTDFPPPAEDEKQVRYLIAEDAGRTFALYLNVMRPGKKIPPHNHTTWACVAAVEGVEINTLYRRLDDGQTEGKAQIEVDRVIELGPGVSVAMMPNDIHSVFIPGTDVIRHLHFYGRALETLSERVMFDPEAGTCKIMSIGVQTRTASV